MNMFRLIVFTYPTTYYLVIAILNKRIIINLLLANVHAHF